MSGSGSSYGAFPPVPNVRPPVTPVEPEPEFESGDPQPSDELHWQRPALLFALTVVSIFYAGATHRILYTAGINGAATEPSFRQTLAQIHTGWTFAVPLLAILLAHEFGHFFAARAHRVPASLPYFLPLPVGFGTLGAVIAMSGRIRSRNALLDIGASGPLAGMVVAIPVLVIGLKLSPVTPLPVDGYSQEGQSLLYWLLKRVVLGPIPAGHDVFLSPTALAGWVGFLITMLNLLPWGQLDGGHIAYALFGKRQDAAARWFRAALIPLALGNLAWFALPIALGRSTMTFGLALLNSLFWFVWWGVLGILALISGGHEHPPCEPGPLSPGRKVVAGFSLLLFVLLFMPRHMTIYY
jgi:membrane-associated protease RseP (regulator of RpoE activity)